MLHLVHGVQARLGIASRQARCGVESTGAHGTFSRKPTEDKPRGTIRLEMSSAGAPPEVLELFKSIDRDGNGTLDPTELEAW